MNFVKHAIVTASVAAAGLGAANLAEAKSVTYQMSGLNVVYQASDPGLVVNVYEHSLPGAFTLNDGESFTFNAFDIWTDETHVNKGEDTTPKPISATFEFSSPLSSGTVNGSTVGTSFLFGIFQNGSVSWGAPAIVDLGDVVYQITLCDATFNSGLFGLSEGYCDGATIKATITQISSSVVPTPSAALAGLAMLGGVVFRRRSNA